MSEKDKEIIDTILRDYKEILWIHNGIYKNIYLKGFLLPIRLELYYAFNMKLDYDVKIVAPGLSLTLNSQTPYTNAVMTLTSCNLTEDSCVDFFKLGIDIRYGRDSFFTFLNKTDIMRRHTLKNILDND